MEGGDLAFKDSLLSLTFLKLPTVPLSHWCPSMTINGHLQKTSSTKMDKCKLNMVSSMISLPQCGDEGGTEDSGERGGYVRTEITHRAY